MSARHASRAQRRTLRIAVPSLVVVLVVAVAVGVLVIPGASRPTSASRAGARRGRNDAGGASTAKQLASAESTTTSTSTRSKTQTTTSTTDPDGSTGLFGGAAIAGYLQSQDSDINAAVYDLDNGQLSLYRPGALEYTASIVKVDILATLLHQAQEQGTALDDEEQDLATTMIENSDDDAATDLWDDIGQQAGLSAFNALVPMPDTVAGTDGHWGGTTTTGADQISLLRELVQPGNVLQPSAQSYELGLMEHVESDQAWGVSAGVPTGVSVALKNGWLPLEDDGDWQVNSIGWIDGDGHDYLIAVLTKNNATEASGIATVEGLSQLVWNALPTSSG